jgi:hypothetical protein
LTDQEKRRERRGCGEDGDRQTAATHEVDSVRYWGRNEVVRGNADSVFN